MTKKNDKQNNLRELKTVKTQHNEEMLSYLDFLREAVKENRLSAAIFVTECDDLLDVTAIGDMNEMEVVGILDTAKLYFQG